MTAGYVISYGFMFAGATALIVHTILYHGKIRLIYEMNEKFTNLISLSIKSNTRC